MTPQEVAVVLLVGVAVGGLSSFFGIGGGILVVPFLVVVMHQPQHLAEGTSLAVIVVTGIAGVAAHRRRGHGSVHRAAVIASGGVAGALAGSALAHRLDGDTLRTTFGIYLIVAGCALVASAIRSGPAHRS